eukprot:TRINITY_DN9988_c0_g1_i1.p1 TRINITY_DN9988_c0_g1~~TRINITY_DN9988_c0_g1_i1.p1  ORF type:complete len:612 (+),score=97.62 TRINITY_DN9988_c0_g1_i1:115-1950(+)
MSMQLIDLDDDVINLDSSEDESSDGEVVPAFDRTTYISNLRGFEFDERANFGACSLYPNPKNCENWEEFIYSKLSEKNKMNGGVSLSKSYRSQKTVLKQTVQHLKRQLTNATETIAVQKKIVEDLEKRLEDRPPPIAEPAAVPQRIDDQTAETIEKLKRALERATSEAEEMKLEATKAKEETEIHKKTIKDLEASIKALKPKPTRVVTKRKLTAKRPDRPQPKHWTFSLQSTDKQIVHSLQFSQDGTFLVASGPRALNIYLTQGEDYSQYLCIFSAAKINGYLANLGEITSCNLSPDGRLLLLSFTDNSARVFLFERFLAMYRKAPESTEIASQPIPKCSYCFRGHLRPILSSVFLPSDKAFALGVTTTPAQKEEQKQKQPAAEKKNGVNYAYVVTGGADTCLKVWNLEYGYCSWTAHSSASVTAMTTVNNVPSVWVCSGHDDGSVRIWDRSMRAPIREFNVKQLRSQADMFVHTLPFSIKCMYGNFKGENLILICSSDGRTCWFEVVNVLEKEVQYSWSVPVQDGMQSGITGCVSPDGVFVATATEGGSEKGLALYNSRDESGHGMLRTDTDQENVPLTACAWKPGSRSTIIAGSRDGRIFIWGDGQRKS